MNKPFLGLVAGGVLGIIDGLTALLSAPEVAPEIMTIVMGSMAKGLVAGVLIGWFGRKVNNLALGVVFGLAIGALFALPIAFSVDPTTGRQYFWEILIPGSMVGLIVGFLTQRYGLRPAATS
ncbi:MAG: hypothetical protein ABI877_18505 [Gemmatimonadaceae bacterium]